MNTQPTFDPITDFPVTDPLGAIFGLLDFERRISGRNHQTLAEMYMRLFVRHPRFVLPTLLDLHMHTAAKLRRRRGMAQLETMINRVAAWISEIPSMTTPSRATEIHIGYAKTMAFLRDRYSDFTSARDMSEDPVEITDFDDTADDEGEGS